MKKECKCKKNHRTHRISLEEIIKEWTSDKKLIRLIPTHYYKRFKIKKWNTHRETRPTDTERLVWLKVRGQREGLIHTSIVFIVE